MSLRTSAIGPCRGREVVIPESAYVYLWKYLDEVDISIAERSQVIEPGIGPAESPATVTQEIPAATEPSNEKPVILVRTNTLLEPSQPGDPSPQFEVTITGPQNETAQIKTRGRHLAKKVLASACKRFGQALATGSSRPACFDQGGRRNPYE